MRRLAIALLVAAAWGLGVATAQAELPSVETATPDAILAAKSLAPKVYSFAENPNILVLDLPGLEFQGAMFNRVVALIERIGAPRDRVLTNDELAAHIQAVGRKPATFAFGNDFRVSELVTFYNLADYGSIELNTEERLLKDFLVANNLMRVKTGFYQVVRPDRVILSVPQEQEPADPGSGRIRVSPLARTTILRHELSHGEYYSNPDYARYCARFWSTRMTDPERAAFRRFLGVKSYDPTNEEMMINEGQAYLMHTPDPGAFNPAALGLSPQAVEALRQKFREGNPPSFLFGR